MSKKGQKYDLDIGKIRTQTTVVFCWKCYAQLRYQAMRKQRDEGYDDKEMLCNNCLKNLSNGKM